MTSTNYSARPNRPSLRQLLRATLFLCVAVSPTPATLFACGPWFPNNLLDGGDPAVLVAPRASFIVELQRMKLVETRLVIPVAKVMLVKPRPGT